MIDYHVVGTNISELRKLNKLTQTEINNNLGIVPPADRVSEMLRLLEFIIKSNIDKITIQ